MKTLNELSKEIKERVQENNLDTDLIDITRTNPKDFLRCPERNNCEYNGLRRECYFHGLYRVCPVYNNYQDNLGIGGMK